MAQSALRALMQGGPAPAGMASAQTAIQNAAQRPQASADMLGGLPFSKEQAAYLAAQFAPGAAMADASGMMPSMPEKGQGLMSTAQSGQFNPSIRQNLQQGNYLDAALQGLGAVGDAAYAIPLAGLTVGNVLKAPRAIDKALDMSRAAYKGTHTAPSSAYGAPLHDMTQIMPADVYDPIGKRLYGMNDPNIDGEVFAKLRMARGKPDMDISVYRAVPKGVSEINPGDWVTTSKFYARNHGDSALNGEFTILEKKIKARELFSAGDPQEFGWNPQTKD